MTTFFLILFFVSIIGWFFAYRAKKRLDQKTAREKEYARQQYKKKRQESVRAKAEQDEIHETIINSITNDFANLGWDEWDESIHRADGQFERLHRAVNAIENGEMTLVRFAANHYAKIKGTKADYYLVNKHRCSCPDFRERGLPCKHMYFLAITSFESEKYLLDDSKKPSEHSLDTTLYGLRFSITGRGQETIKRYILSHSGTFGNDSWKLTSAVVSADGEKTARTWEALSREVEVLSSDDLKQIVSDWGGVDGEE